MASAVAPARAKAVFVYGSLMSPAVLQCLLDRVPPTVDGELPGFYRRRLRERKYPGILPVVSAALPSGMGAGAGAIVTTAAPLRGKVLFDLDAAESEILDEFEDYIYTKQTVRVTVASGDANAEALLRTLDNDGGSSAHDGSGACREVDAECYVISPQHADVMIEDGADWSYEHFEAALLQSYMQMCNAFVAELRAEKPHLFDGR